MDIKNLEKEQRSPKAKKRKEKRKSRNQVNYKHKISREN